MDEPPSKTFFEAIISGDSLVIWSGCAVIVLLILMSALVSASESVFFSLKGNDLQSLENSTNEKARMIAQLLKVPQLLFSTIVILAYFVNSAIIVASGLYTTKLSVDQSNRPIISFSLIVVLTFVISVFAVIVPKVYATGGRVKFVSRVAGIWNFITRQIRPLIGFLFLGKKNYERIHKGSQTSVGGLNEALVKGAGDEQSEDEREMLKGIVNFGTLTVRQVMRSRVDIAALDIELNFHELMNLINKSGFSRMPVYRETVDRIEGVLYIKDLLPFIDHDENFKWLKLIRPGFFVPENKKIDVLLKDFQRRHVHMAIVVDEYGGTLGLITLEDIIEEIIGEINDEFDDETSPFRRIDENTFVFEGKTSLHDFCKVVEVGAEVFDEIKGDSESLGGLILELNNELPNVGKKISFEQFTFIIEAVDKRRIKRVRVRVHEQKESQ